MAAVPGDSLFHVVRSGITPVARSPFSSQGVSHPFSSQ